VKSQCSECLLRHAETTLPGLLVAGLLVAADVEYGEEGFRNQGIFSKGLLLKVGGVVATGIGIFLGVQ